MTDLVLAVDGGNVKTDLALVAANGELLSLVRGGRSSPHYLGVEGCVKLLEGLLADALSEAGLARKQLRAVAAQIMVAGADLPEELAALRAQIEGRGWAHRPVVDNDTFALLRSGTDRGWGVAVVCGGGINCVGLAPDGSQARFLSLGAITGDWGGGYDVGIAALMAAARSADGRGPRTILETAVPEYFELADPLEVARALHLQRLPVERLGELARVVYSSAEADPAAAAIVARLADEVIALATTALRRLGLIGEDSDVVLGGGLIRAAPRSAIERIERGVRDAAPRAQVLVAPSAPIVGAALLGLDEIGVNSTAAERARSELQAAFIEVEGGGTRVVNGHTGASPAGEERGLRSTHG
ncbi:MAG: ATPase [Actinomycetota bacterium]|nr:ATPase [Actinomycetota bacterium]